MFDWGLSLECVLVVRAPSSLEVRGYSSTMTTKSVLGQLSHRGKVLSLRVSLSVSLSLSLHLSTFSHSLLLILFITKVVKLIMECHCLKIVSDITEQRGELPFLVFGDFSARRRTANADECVIARLPDSVSDMDSDNETAQNQYRRESKDLYTNEIQTQKGSNERLFILTRTQSTNIF